jgi:hypothetical protein
MVLVPAEEVRKSLRRLPNVKKYRETFFELLNPIAIENHSRVATESRAHAKVHERRERSGAQSPQSRRRKGDIHLFRGLR